jgi:hypothetical protein
VAKLPAGNPFHYGTPAEGDHFTGRQYELDALLTRMRHGVNVVLLSPRRYGKTSLLRAAQSRLSKGRPAAAIIEVNVLRATSLSGLVGLLTARAFHLPGSRWQRARQAVPEFLRRVRVSPVVTFDPNGSPRFGFDAAIATRDAESVLADLYDLLAEEADRRPAVLVLDEFQAITRHGASLPDVFKALADEHPRVSLVLAGSKRHLMEDLVIRERAPLFGMAQRMSLGPIPDDDMVAYLHRRAAGAGKPFDATAASYLLSLAGPVPNDIQHLAFEAYEAAGSVIDASDVDRGLARAVAHDNVLYAENLARLSPGQGRVLAALAWGAPIEPYSSAFARSVGLASGSSVRKALQPLLINEDVIERPDGLVVADPFFAAWLRGDSPEDG